MHRTAGILMHTPQCVHRKAHMLTIVIGAREAI